MKSSFDFGRGVPEFFFESGGKIVGVRKIYRIVSCITSTITELLAVPIKGGSFGGRLPSAPSQTPIDGGLGLLAALGGGYAVKKLKDRKTE